MNSPNIPMLETLKIRIAEVGDRHAIAEVVVDDTHRNYFGGAHGGLVATLVDTVCFFPRPLIPSGTRATTSSLSISYVRPASTGERLRARSELLHLGRRTASLSVRVTDGQDRLVAHATATLILLPAEGVLP